MRLPVIVDAPAYTGLPPRHARWAAALSPQPLPDEPHATCGSCAMLRPDDAPDDPDALHFDAATRCCTYAPSLANFLVGSVLRDPGPDAATSSAVLLARIAARRAVTPLGIDPTAATQARYDEVTRAEGFGRSPDLRCPHLRADLAESCGIWRHRNGTCATWFCKHDRGGRAMAFWSRLRDLFALVEGRLARWCALDLDDATLSRAIAARRPPGRRGDDALDDDDAYRARWGRWIGREAEFFVECAARVDALSWDDVLRICGADAEALARTVRHARRALDVGGVPSALRVGADVTVRDLGDGAATVHAYSHYDPLVVPSALVAALPRFDGRPLDAVRAALADEGVVIDVALLRQLVDFEVLVPAAE